MIFQLFWFLYYKKRTSFVVSTEISSQFKNKMKTTTTTGSAFFLCTAVIHTTFTTHTVSCNMPKTSKKSNFEEISSSKTRKSYVFIFFSKFNTQQYTRIRVSRCFPLIHCKGTSSPTPYNIKGLYQRGDIVHKKKDGNTSITK